MARTRKLKEMTNACMKYIDKDSHGGLISYLKKEAADSQNQKPSEMDMAGGEASIPDNIKLNELID